MNTKKIEKLILKHINKSREKRNIPTVSGNSGLRKCAREHSSKMASAGRIWHGDGVHLANKRVTKNLFETILDAFIRSGNRAGENVAMTFSGRVQGIHKEVRSERDVARALHKMWMKSSGHRANILNNEFAKVGVGVIQKGKKFYATELFYG
jgi:uncharacterized protein YkwD